MVPGTRFSLHGWPPTAPWESTHIRGTVDFAENAYRRQMYMYQTRAPIPLYLSRPHKYPCMPYNKWSAGSDYRRKIRTASDFTSDWITTGHGRPSRSFRGNEARKSRDLHRDQYSNHATIGPRAAETLAIDCRQTCPPACLRGRWISWPGSRLSPIILVQCISNLASLIFRLVRYWRSDASFDEWRTHRCRNSAALIHNRAIIELRRCKGETERSFSANRYNTAHLQRSTYTQPRRLQANVLLVNL